MRIMRKCSGSDLGFPGMKKRLSKSSIRASSLPMTSLRPLTVSSTEGAMIQNVELGNRIGK